MLHALSNVQLSQLMDRDRWDFKGLRAEVDLAADNNNEDESLPWAPESSDTTVDEVSTQPVVWL